MGGIIFRRIPECSKCRKPIEIGEGIVIKTTGVRDVVGGVGVYADQPVVKNERDEMYHEKCEGKTV